MKRGLLSGLTVAASLTAVVLCAPAQEATAGTLLGLDLGLAVDTGDLPVDPGGPGPAVAVRFGYELPIPVVRIVPEAQLGYASFSADDKNGNPTQQILTGRAGLRLGIGGVIGPALFAHVGFGDISGEGSDFVIEKSGLSYDVGLSVDFTLLPLLNLGIHGAWNALEEDDPKATFQWLDFGIHAELNF